MSAGYVKLDRDILENPWVNKDLEYLGVMMYLIRIAAFAEHDTVFNGQTISLKVGQLVTGRKKLSSETGVEEHKVQRILKRFESEHLIEQQVSSRGSLISLVFMMSDSKSEQLNDQQMSNKRAASEQQLSTTEIKNKRIKEIKEKDVSKDTSQKKSQTYAENPDVDKAIKDFIDYRKKNKKDPMSDRAINRFLNDLHKLSMEPDQQIELIDYAMLHGWKTVYPIRGDTRAAPKENIGSYDPELQRLAEENYQRMMEEQNAVSSW